METSGTIKVPIQTVELHIHLQRVNGEFELTIGSDIPPRVLVYDSRRKLAARVKAAIEAAFPESE